jgi:hypothetical protein
MYEYGIYFSLYILGASKVGVYMLLRCIVLRVCMMDGLMIPLQSYKMARNIKKALYLFGAIRQKLEMKPKPVYHGWLVFKCTLARTDQRNMDVRYSTTKCVCTRG